MRSKSPAQNTNRKKKLHCETIFKAQFKFQISSAALVVLFHEKPTGQHKKLFPIRKLFLLERSLYCLSHGEIQIRFPIVFEKEKLTIFFPSFNSNQNKKKPTKMEIFHEGRTKENQILNKQKLQKKNPYRQFWFFRWSFLLKNTPNNMNTCIYKVFLTLKQSPFSTHKTHS